jgi:hypothetical protein
MKFGEIPDNSNERDKVDVTKVVEQYVTTRIQECCYQKPGVRGLKYIHGLNKIPPCFSSFYVGSTHEK